MTPTFPRTGGLVSLRAVAACVLVSLVAGCAHGGAPRAERQPTPAEAAERRVEQATMSTTVLDAHQPTVTQVEARIALGTTGAPGLTPAEVAQLQTFARDFVRTGRGNIVFSVPVGSGNAAASQQITAEAQRVLFAEGVDYARMAGGAYQAAGQPVAPVVVAFIRYEARAADCPGWGELDPRRTASNMNSPRFGCAQAGNLAAMVVDPGDLTGDRRETPGDAVRAQRGVDQMREGTLPEASGTVAGGN